MFVSHISVPLSFSLSLFFSLPAPSPLSEINKHILALAGVAQ